MRTKKALRWFLYVLIGFIAIVFIAYGIAIWKKQDILAYVNKTLNDKIQGTISIQDFVISPFENFPLISLTLVNPIIQDSLYQQHHQTLFQAKKVSARINIWKLITRQIQFSKITLTDATIELITTKDGYSNLSAFKKQNTNNAATASSTSAFDVEHIDLERVHFSLKDEIKDKSFLIDFNKVAINSKALEDSIKSLNVKGSVHFGGLGFNLDKGMYLADKDAGLNLNLDFNTASQTLIIQPSYLNIDKQIHEISGKMVFSTKPPSFELNFKVDGVNYANELTLLTKNISDKLSKFNIDQPLFAEASIKGVMAPRQQPDVQIYFKSKNVTNVGTDKILFTGVHLEGVFINKFDSLQPISDANSALILPAFSGYFLNAIPLKAKLKIVNLDSLRLYMKATVDMPLTELNRIGDTTMDFSAGDAHVRFNYAGNFTNFADSQTYQIKAAINGYLKVSNAGFEYFPKNYHFTQINASFNFDQQNLNLDSVYLLWNENPVKVTGQVNQMIPGLFFTDSLMLADLYLTCDTFNLNKILDSSPPAAKSAKKLPTQKAVSEKQPVNTGQESGFQNAFSIDNILRSLIFNLTLNAQQLKYKNFRADHLNALVRMDQGELQLNNVSCNTSGGNFFLKAAIKNSDRPVGNLNLYSKISNVRVNDLFYSFDNFNQDAITHKNIQGQLNAEVYLSTGITKDFKILPSTMNGKLYFSLKNGMLINMSALDQISKYVFKDRDFNNIEFASISDTFRLKGRDISIPRMQIASSVMTFFIEGVYSFGNNTDLSIQIPLSNLKKRDQEVKVQNSGNKTKGGMSIYLKATNDKDGKIKIGYDPFPGKKRK